MKRIALIATAALCALAMCLCSIPALSVFAENDTPELTNVALNKPVAKNDNNSIDDIERFALAYLTDGSALTSWHSDYINTDGSSATAPTILTVNLGGACMISSMNVYSYTGDVYATAALPDGVPVLPQAFTLEAFSVEENDWVEVATYDLDAWVIEVPDPDVLTFDFDPVEATQVRMIITENGGYWDPNYFRSGITLVGELEVMGYALGGSTETETEAPEVTETETSAPVESDLVDVALNQYAEATFSIEGGNWGAQNLVMGNKSNEMAGWHHDMSATISAQNAPEILIWLDRVSTIHQIDLYPSAIYHDAYVSVMPQEFTIELSADGGQTWVTVATETGVVSQVAGMAGHADNGNMPAINVPYSIVLDEATDANVFRMTITKGGTGRSSNTMLGDPTYGGNYAAFTVIGSIEMLGVMGEASTETETQAPAVTETQAPSVTETEAPEVTETEAPEETVVETVVESDVESAEESDTTAETVVDETVADTGVEETVADTTAATDAPATADEGCASVVGFGAVAVLAAAAAAVVLKKKD